MFHCWDFLCDLPSSDWITDVMYGRIMKYTEFDYHILTARSKTKTIGQSFNSKIRNLRYSGQILFKKRSKIRKSIHLLRVWHPRKYLKNKEEGEEELSDKWQLSLRKFVFFVAHAIIKTTSWLGNYPINVWNLLTHLYLIWIFNSHYKQFFCAN